MGPRPRRTGAVAAALALLALVGWWATREAGFEPPPPAVAPSAPVPAPEAAPAGPAPPEPAPSPDPVRTTVRILDARNGEPVEHTVLSVEPLLALGPVESREAGPGGLEIAGPPGSVVRLVADAKGFVPAERAFTLGRPSLDLHLCPVGTLQVKVVDAREGSPIPGAWVHVEGEPILHRGRNLVRAWSGRTDAEGWVSCPEGGPGRDLTVIVTAEDRAPVVLSGEAPPEGVVVAAPEAGRVVVSVGDRGGTPIEGAQLLPLRADGTPAVPERLATITGPDGRGAVPAAARRLGSGSLAVLVTAPGRSPSTVLVEDRPVMVRLEEAIPAGVTVLDRSGAPLPGIPVRIVPIQGPRGFRDSALPGAPLETGADGRAALPAVESGTDYLVAVGGISDLPLASLVRRGEQLRRFPEVRVAEAVPRRVRVEDPGGAPAPGVTVILAGPGALEGPGTAWDPVFEGPSGIRTGEDGAVEILATEGILEAVVAAAGPTLLGSSPPAGAGKPTLVRLRAPGLLRVAVKDEGGEPVPAATVTVRPRADGTIPPAILAAAAQRGWTGPGGTVEFEVPGGVPLLVEAASAGSLNREAVEVAVGEARSGNADFVLRSPRRVWVVITDRSGKRTPGAAVDVHIQGLSSPWLARGVADERGVLGVHLPAVDYRPPGAERPPRVHFAVSGPVTGASSFPNPEVVDNVHVAADDRNPGSWILPVESPLFPEGTPFRFLVRREDDDPFAADGEGRVGRPFPSLPPGQGPTGSRSASGASLPSPGPSAPSARRTGRSGSGRRRTASGRR